MGGKPSPFVNSFAQPAIGSLRYNTSQFGSPLPICYGTQRISINILEFWNYQGGSGKGGKGGGGKGGKGKKSANYSVDVAMAFCQGPISYEGSIYGQNGGNRIWANAGISYFGQVDINAYSGNDGQAPDPTFEASDPNQPVLGYSGTAYVTGTPLQLGQSPSLPNISGEITGFEAGTFGSTNPNDANPNAIIQDFLTNTRYGAGFPIANFDAAGSFADYGNYCIAYNLAMSILMANCQPASQWLDYILTNTVATVFFSAGLLKITPYPVTPGAGWSPNTTIQYSLTDRDFIDWGGESDPVITTRSDPAMATNWFAVEYYDTTNSYNPNIAYRFDQGAIDQYGLRNESPQEAHCFTNLAVAQASAEWQLQRKQQVRNKFKFQVGWTFALLDPMDLIEITDSTAGLNTVVCRIISIEENENGALTIEGEEVPGVPAIPPKFVEVIPTSGVPNTFAPPGNPNAPFIFEPPSALTGGAPTQAWMLVTGPGAYYGGSNIWVSYDDTTYEQVGLSYHGGVLGVLTAGLALAAPGVDTTNTLSVDISESFAAELNSVTMADANILLTLCAVEDELIAYATATLTGTQTYDLTYLIRGAYGTSPAAHPVGAPFAYLNQSVFDYTFPTNFIGGTFYVKLQAFNIYGQMLQDLTTCPATGYTVVGTTIAEDPEDVTNLTDYYVGNITNLTWTLVKDYRVVNYEIRKGAAWSGAQVLGTVSGPPFQTQGNGTYWVGSVTQPAAGIKIYGINPQSITITGAVIAPFVLESYQENPAWTGALGGSAARSGTWIVTSPGGAFLPVIDFLGLTNFLDIPGTGQTSGSYTIPNGHIIDVGRVATSIVDVEWQSQGIALSANFLGTTNFLTIQDMLGYEQSSNVSVYPQIALSQDGSTFGAWQNFSTGSYTAWAIKVQMILMVLNSQVQAVLESMTFSVYPPERDDHYMNISVPSGGLTIMFTPDGSSVATPFNGGPNDSPVPYVDATIIGGSAGDVAVWSSLTDAHVTLQITNGGSGVARTCNILAQGY